ncbi:MAG TPA: hypothetical protein VNT60_00730 [Deinococcales bacterium]|nr:hypothetical protein [Deinococcales bacterium]
MRLDTAGLNAATARRAGVAALLHELTRSALPGEVSVGRVCGGRVSAVWLGASLAVVSATLEAHELDEAVRGAERALALLDDIRANSLGEGE